MPDDKDAREAGLEVRRKILGDAWVDRALAARSDFTADFQDMITRNVWDEIWNRPGLDHRTRRLLVVAVTASLGAWEEFRLHVRAGLEQKGFSAEELKEVLLQLAAYAGAPAANTAFAEAKRILESLKPQA
jgi:3-oxoadipate enol-lactonase/4-carboxymuconolactone decarboxylase